MAVSCFFETFPAGWSNSWTSTWIKGQRDSRSQHPGAGFGLENFSYPSLSLGPDHQEFPSLSLETETDFSEPRSQKMRLTFKSLRLSLEN